MRRAQAATTTGPTEPRQRFDLGRMLVLPVMTLFGVLPALQIAQALPSLGSASALEVAHLVRAVLLLAFYVLVVAFYFLRAPARSNGGSFVAHAVAVTATFTPVVISLLTRPTGNLALVALGDVLACAGIAWSVWALSHLGRNLSIIAQARSLVRSGPYRVVRHPLYAGELVAILGIVVGGFSWPAFAVLALLAALQISRAVTEEALLAGIFPEYGEYRVTTARLLPGIY